MKYKIVLIFLLTQSCFFDNLFTGNDLGKNKKTTVKTNDNEKRCAINSQQHNLVQKKLFKGIEDDNAELVKQALEEGADLTATGVLPQTTVNIKDEKLNRVTFKLYAPVLSAVFSPDGTKVLTTSQDYTAVLWDIKGKKRATFKHGDWVNSAVFSPDGNRVLTASGCTTVLWNLEGNKQKTFKHNAPVYSAVFSPDGTKVLTASRDSSAILWDLEGNRLQTFIHDSWVNSAVFSPNGTKVLTASGWKYHSGKAVLWDLHGNKQKTFKHNRPVRSAVFSPDGTKVLTTSQDYTAVLWDIKGKKRATFKHGDWVNSAVFSPDGNNVLTASNDYTAVLWNLLGKKLAILLHNGPVWSAVFSPDGNKVLTASQDYTAVLWDLEGKELKTFMHNKTVLSAVFSPDGNKVLTAASYDNIAVLWDLEEDTAIDLAVQQACQRGNTRVLKILLDASHTLQGRCNNTLLHRLCHAAYKVKIHNLEQYDFLCNVLQLILYKKGLPLLTHDINGLTPIDLANNYNLNEFVTRMILVLLLHPYHVCYEIT